MLDTEPSDRDVLTCVFGIQRREVRTYQTLLDNPGSTVEELAEELDRDRSNVNRSLRILREKNLAVRRRRLLDSGGEVYHYSARPLDEARDLMHRTLDAWTQSVHERIDEFGERT